MANLLELHQSASSRQPSWSFSFRSDRHYEQLNHLSHSSLRMRAKDSRFPKHQLVENVLSLYEQRFSYTFLSVSSSTYAEIADHVLGPFPACIRQAIRSSHPVLPSIARESHPLYCKDIRSSIMDAIALVPAEDILILRSSLLIVERTGSGGVHYVSTGNNCIYSKHLFKLLVSCFQRDFHALYTLQDEHLVDICLAENAMKRLSVDFDIIGCILRILAVRGYPTSVLLKIHAISLAADMALEQNHTENQKKLAELVRLGQTWPQPIAQSTVLSCVEKFYRNIQYSPPHICASCGSEDRDRTGDFINV
ncbi:hypothetical protein BT96DRAFT_1019996 [Gymnopus androsaceus JB14]|uniref:Uncharacterized protein n=1 Tax=Gymnopus androsaceus JB14 TaxID=1447944 RepID=A0A6A4HJG5_9AGAR|nr:hypothetical protein BT96DRAFT_1019996 [Gymnopus androsaceus JB14]